MLHSVQHDIQYYFQKRGSLLWGTLLFVFALAVRVVIVTFWQFDGLYGQDALAYYKQGMAIVANVPRGLPPPTDFFWPNGYPLLIALFTVVLGQTASAALWPSLLMGAALAPLSYSLSRRLFPAHGHHAGLMAGLIVAVAGQFLLSSVSAMSDMPALFWGALAVWTVVSSQRSVVSSQTTDGRRQTTDDRPQTTDRGRQTTDISPQSLVFNRPWSMVRGPSSMVHRPWSMVHRPSSLLLLAAGLALGMALITRWLYALLIPAIVVYILVTTQDGKRRLMSLVYIGVGGVLVVGPQLWLSLNRPDALYHHWLAGWSPLNAIHRQFQTSDGVQAYRWPVAVFYAIPFFHPAYLFPTFGLAAVWGTWRLWQRRAWAALTLFLGWASAGYLFLAGIPYENFRYSLIHAYPAVLLAGYGISVLWTTRWRRLVQAVTAVSLAGLLLWAYPMLDQFLTTQNTSKVIARQVARVVPPDATVLALGLTATLDHYTPLNVVEFFNETPTTLAGRVCQGTLVYLLLDVSALERQWTGYPVHTAFDWLRHTPGLDTIAFFEDYTLFKVGQRYCTGWRSAVEAKS